MNSRCLERFNNLHKLQLLRRCIVDQTVHRFRQGIITIGGQSIRGKHARGSIFARTQHLFFNNACGITHRGCTGRYFLDHNGVGANLGALTYRERAKHLGTGTNDGAATERGMPLGAFGERGAAESDALIDRAIITDLGGFTDDHAKAMINEYPPTNRRPGVNFNARQTARNMGNKSSYPFETCTPAGIGPAMHHDRVQTGIAGQDLPAAAGCRVAFDDAADIFLNLAEHGTLNV